MNKIELKLQQLQSVNGWISLSDTKAFALLGAQGLFFAFIISAVVSDGFYKYVASCWPLIILACALLLNGASVVFSFMAVNPRLKLKGGPSPFYFGSVAESFKDSKGFSVFCADRLKTEDAVAFELDGQIYVNSTIAWKKFKAVAYAIRFLVGSLAFWGLFVVLVIGGNV
jgi:hypothetical protein